MSGDVECMEKMRNGGRGLEDLLTFKTGNFGNF
jgi:hypothetical protein